MAQVTKFSNKAFAPFIYKIHSPLLFAFAFAEQSVSALIGHPIGAKVMLRNVKNHQDLLIQACCERCNPRVEAGVLAGAASFSWHAHLPKTGGISADGVEETVIISRPSVDGIKVTLIAKNQTKSNRTVTSSALPRSARR
jgi:hypothetical protein